MKLMLPPCFSPLQNKNIASSNCYFKNFLNRNSFSKLFLLLLAHIIVVACAVPASTTWINSTEPILALVLLNLLEQEQDTFGMRTFYSCSYSYSYPYLYAEPSFIYFYCLFSLDKMTQVSFDRIRALIIDNLLV